MKNLDPDLFQVLTLDIPEATPREVGFLDVAGHSTRETTICNVYSYFLDPELSPLLSPLMLEALEDLIEEKYARKKVKKELDFSEFEVMLELGTGNGRIDIVIESEASQSVVIIEAKVYHVLDNDLEDYWNRFPYADNRKVGIVLAINPFSDLDIKNENFISVTHWEWLNNVCSKGLPVNLPMKDYLYFNDFVNNMNRLTKSSEMNEQAKFYFDYSSKVDKAIETKSEALKYVIAQLHEVAGHFDLELFGNSDSWRHIKSNNNDQVYYTLLPLEILEKKQVLVILEVAGDKRSVRESYQEEMKDEVSKGELNLSHSNLSHVTHIVSKTYTLKKEKMDQMAATLIEGIENDLEPVREKLKGILEKSNKN
ncbi:PD-(D/E)XK nuclease family protein [Halocola ammonii]